MTTLRETLPSSTTFQRRLLSFWQQQKCTLFLIGGMLAALWLLWYLYDSAGHEETDNAYLAGHLHAVSSRLAGVVSEVLVEDNQVVQAGQMLVKLDPQEMQVLVAVAQANLAKSQADLDRDLPLLRQNAVTPQQVDAAQQQHAIDEAQTQYAQLQLHYTQIVAPAAGRIARKNVEVGNRVQAGQTLLMLVQPDIWVVANFKETQLAKMRPGQPVEIRVDRLPGHVFQGQVDSFAPGSGNQFALLPADNSTGNFTKIVQRVPVKIVFNPASIHDYAEQLVPGISVVVRVSLETK